MNGCPFDVFMPKRGLRQGHPMSPLLFVLGMEYLSRMLDVVGTQNLFKFHPRCRKIKLTHICFADDLMLFSKGDPHSISLLCQCLDGFF